MVWNRLSNRIIILFLLSSVLPLLGISGFSYITGRESLKEAAINRLSTINSLKSSEFRNLIENNQKQLRILSQDPRMNLLVSRLLVSSSTDKISFNKTGDEIVQDYLQPLINENAGFIAFSLIDAQSGEILLSTIPGIIGENRGDYDFFIQGLKDVYIQRSIQIMNNEERVLFISAPVINDEGQVIAVLSGRTNLIDLMNIISINSGNSQSEETYLVDEANTLILKTEPFNSQSLMESISTYGVSDCLDGNSGNGLYRNYEDVPVVGVYEWLADWQICIVTEESQSEAFLAIEQLSSTILVASVFSLAVSVIAGLSLARSINQPIKKLIIGADQIGNEELGYHIELKGSQEMMHLAAAFNQMSDNLLLADEKNKQLLIELKSWSKELEKRVDDRTLELEINNAFTESIINSMPGIFYMINKNGDFIRWNKNLEEVTGYIYEEISRLRPIDIFPQQDREMIEESIQDTFEIGEAILDTHIMAKDGKVTPYYITGLRTELDGQYYAIRTGIDMTELKQAEAALLEINKELARSNEELERFAYISSHDLQEPLRMVTSYLQLLERRYKSSLDDDAREFIDFAVDGATRMKQLINDLLSLSRVGTRGQELVPVSSQDALDYTLRDYVLLISETGASITYDQLPMVMADISQLKQVFHNLIGNAIKFCRDKNPDISISAKRVNHFWEFCISDNGIGIDQQFFDRIFIIFQRLHNSEEYKGTGIGLALCKKIIERHGGTIWVESAIGEGSKFYFTLPAVENKGE